MKNLYVRKGLKKNLKLNRTYPVKVNPSEQVGGIQARIKRNISKRLKETPKKVSKSLIRTIDPYSEEEIDSGIESVLQTKKGVDNTKKGYQRAKELSQSVKRLNTKVKAIKSGGGRSRPLRAYRKIKGAGATQSSGTQGTATKIKTLSSRFVPKNKYSFLPSTKSSMKTGLHSPIAAVRATVQKLTNKLTVAAASNPKVWIIGAIVGALFFLLMAVTNSLGGSATSAGSFFMTDNENAALYKDKVDELNEEFQRQIESYSNNSSYDDVNIEYMNDEGTLQINWVEIFALVAVNFEQDLTFTQDQESYMNYLFNEFSDIRNSTETYYETVCSSVTDPKTGKTTTECRDERRTRLIVKVYTYDMEEVFTKIGFTEDQQEWARRLVTSGAIEEQFPELGGSSGPELPGSLTPEERAELIENLGGDIDAARAVLIETALTLVGEVPYFWGGKSPAGWNDLWNTPVKVTAPGSDTTGTYQPFGMDCSGFVDWAFKTAGLGNVFSAGGTSYQWTKTFSISWDELIPGDLVFKNKPGQGGVNHIGIYIGRDEGGNPIYVHCAGSSGVVVNGYKGFKYPRRPLLFQ